MSKTSKILIITGKTASGKDTIISKILKRYPYFKKVVTTTSRKIRQKEKDGVDYYFISEDEFRQKIEEGQFLEYVEYGGNLYGTTHQELEALLSDDIIWKIDPSRAGEIRDFIKRAYLENETLPAASSGVSRTRIGAGQVLSSVHPRNKLRGILAQNKAFEIIKRILVIYITTSDEVILQRLKKRNLTIDEIQKRIRDDQNIWQKYKDKYDYVLENASGKLDETISHIVKIIDSYKI